jgi:ECF transporter S component (folate family)
MQTEPKINDIKSERVTIREFFDTKDVFCVQNLVMMGIMIAVAAVLSRFSIYITPTFKAIGFTYLPGALVAMMFGPWSAIAYGFISDAVTYIMNPQGGYFPGFAVSEMLACFIYACFLYKRPVTLLRVVLARLLILVLVVFGLNFIWMNMMYGQIAGGYYTGARLINNLVQFPFHALLIRLIGKRTMEIKNR